MRTVDDYFKKIRFSILSWNTRDEILDVVVEGERRRYRWKNYEDRQECVDDVERVFSSTRSPWKAVKRLELYADRVDAPPVAAKKPRYDRPTKMVRCNACGHEAPIGNNPPGTRCPNCGDGELDVF